MELKPIDQSDGARSRLDAALSIYRNTILPEAQNPERQILYWIAHSSDTLSDEFKCFALQEREAVVGYLQYSYFREENIFFLEYFCVNPSPRGGLAPSRAVDAVKRHLADNYPPNFKVVFEVARTRGDEGGWVADAKLIRYFERLGFRTVSFDYRYPILQSYDGTASYPADLMVNLPGGQKEVSASELRTILRCIYFKHYLRWDRPFLNREQFEQRERYITALFNEQVARIDDQGTFGTRGDDRRSGALNILRTPPRIGPLVERVFGPKLPRIIVVMGLMLGLERLIGGVLKLIPFMLVSAALYCLAEDTEASRRLFSRLILRFGVIRQRSS